MNGYYMQRNKILIVDSLQMVEKKDYAELFGSSTFVFITSTRRTG
jgi:hypothetical protein